MKFSESTVRVGHAHQKVMSTIDDGVRCGVCGSGFRLSGFGAGVECNRDSGFGVAFEQGYLAHKKKPPPPRTTI